ncbi:GTPase [Guptibacillus hwajinpoensis]|uniref:GTPase n=1 Tax=Guptibacillus hwajinpoensis TaxID=208199 RepID=UPI003850B14B
MEKLIGVGFTMKLVKETEFTDVLKECKKTARDAYKQTQAYKSKMATILDRLYAQLTEDSIQLFVDEDARNFEFATVLTEIIHRIGTQNEGGLEDLEVALKRKKKTLDSFTLALFGRTKAGKSTIREALTKGDGSTIGKGSQRTTRDVFEYEWKGLRLIDVPGIEAYGGEEDTFKAQDIIDQSDMIIFLTTDDSVQEGEFNEMARLQELNKHFFVVMNVKRSLMDQETDEPKLRDIKRFIRNPNWGFDLDELREHGKHIGSYVKKHLGIPFVDVTWIHAQAAYLSTLPKLNEYEEELWKISQLETVYDRIKNEINRNGKHRRVLTFYDSTIHYIDTIEKMLWNEHHVIKEQAKLMIEKKNELKEFFNHFIPDSNCEIEDNVELLYASIRQWIPSFVENNIGTEEAKELYENRLKEHQDQVQASMEIKIGEIVIELQNYLNEFSRQYRYDVGTIDMEFENIGDFKKGQINKILKWSGITLGSAGSIAIAAAGWGAANFWNPVGWISIGVGSVLGIAKLVVGKREQDKWREAKQDANQSLLENIDKIERKTKSIYKGWFYENITTKGKREMIDQVTSYIDGLFRISGKLRESAKEVENLKNDINKDLFTSLMKLEGIHTTQDDLKAIAREQGVLTKIIVPEKWCLDGSYKNALDSICGEPVSLISEEADKRKMVAKALYPGKITLNDIKFIEKHNRTVAQVTVSNEKKGLFIGKKGVNIKLAQKLCNINIEII